MKYLELETFEVPNGKIVSIFLNNSEARNAMTWQMGEEFEKAIMALKKDLPRVVIVSGRNSVFCAGGDLTLLRSFSTKTYRQNKRDMQKFYAFFLSVLKLQCPVIAAVNGHAIGAGLSLAFACDLRVMAKEGKYSFNFVRLGIHPGMGSSYLAPKLLGTSLGNRLLFTGETFNGEDAYRLGLSNHIVPMDSVYKTAFELAKEIANSAPLALQELKSNLYSWKEMEKSLAKEAKSQARNFLSSDFKETLQAVSEKRSPVFLGK